jgi:DNA-binding CsgD family transcriptional regulator
MAEEGQEPGRDRGQTAVRAPGESDYALGSSGGLRDASGAGGADELLGQDGQSQPGADQPFDGGQVGAFEGDARRHALGLQQLIEQDAEAQAARDGHGFLLKDADLHDLLAAVRTAAAGNALLAPSVTIRLIDVFARRSAQTLPVPSRLASLTAREREILLRLARGLTNAEIAADLVVSEATVKSHVGNLLAKLGLRDRVQAVILAYETGIVRPGGPDTAS